MVTRLSAVIVVKVLSLLLREKNFAGKQQGRLLWQLETARPSSF